MFWSARGANNAVIYQLDRNGERTQVWNIETAGSLNIATRSSARGQINFEFVASNDLFESTQTLAIPLACPTPWFFIPSPSDCPDREADEVFVIEQSFERGRMIYISSTDTIYALFNDSFDPAWIAFQNRYDPAIHPELEESFVPPPNFYQPVGILGFLWRGNDTARNRLGLATEPELPFDGFVQTADSSLYISSTGGVVVQLLPEGGSWQIITLSPQ